MADLGPPIAEHVVQDLRSLLSSFFTQRNLSYAQFKRIWWQMSMSHLHHVAPPNVDLDAFYQLCFDLVLRMLNEVSYPQEIVSLQLQSYNDVESSGSTAGPSSSSSSSSSSIGAVNVTNGGQGFSCLNLVDDSEGKVIIWNVGVVYLLYTLYATQIRKSRSLVNISPEFFSSLKMAVEQISWIGKIGISAVQVFNHMVKEELFVFGLCMGPLTPWGAQRWEKLVPSTINQLSKAIELNNTLSAKRNTAASSGFERRISDLFAPYFEESAARITPPTETAPGEEEEGADEEKDGENCVDTDSVVNMRAAVSAKGPRKSADKVKRERKKKTSLNMRDTINAVMDMRPGARLLSSSSQTVSAATATSSSKNTPVAAAAASQQEEEEEEEEEANREKNREDEKQQLQEEEDGGDDDDDDDGDEGESDDDSGESDSEESQDGGRIEYVSTHELKRRRLQEHYKKLDQKNM